MRALSRLGRSQSGQAMVLLAVVVLALLSGVGLAIDGGYYYYSSVEAGRAAAAGALSGVVFMPDRCVAPPPACSSGSACQPLSRAVAEARRNGFDVADTANQVTVTACQGTSPDQLQVTVKRTVPTLFMRILGLNSMSVSQSSVASYLPPVGIGQTGSQIGATTSQLGSGNNKYFMQTEGWWRDRVNGDPFTPNPAWESRSTLSPPSTDVHQISAQRGSDTVDPSLPARGGYNYLITIPAGTSAHIQVYNAAFGPDDESPSPNNCDNLKPRTCNGNGALYYYHEGEGFDRSDKTKFVAMEYTLFQVTNPYVRSTDQVLSQFKVFPLDASNWSQSSNQYKNVNTGGTVTQTYDSGGYPTNMRIYHWWVDVNDFDGEVSTDGGLVQALKSTAGGPLPAGTYRLRVDTLNNDGSIPSDNNPNWYGANKAYAVQVATDAAGTAPCATCSLSAMDDMAFFTPVTLPLGATSGSFSMPLFSLPQEYAGNSIYVDFYDVGDICPGCLINVDINMLTPPSDTVAAGTSAQPVTVSNLGTSRRSATTATPIPDPTNTATFRATAAGTQLYPGQWVEMVIPVPSDYNPGATTTWSLQYVISGSPLSSANAHDTLTVAVGLYGSPAHLVSG